MIIVGEKINGSIPSVGEAIKNHDSEFIKERAKIQAGSGATYIDCCASVDEEIEVETLKWMIDCIQEVTDLPIAVDSPSADVSWQLINSVISQGSSIPFPWKAIKRRKSSRKWRTPIGRSSAS